MFDEYDDSTQRFLQAQAKYIFERLQDVYERGFTDGREHSMDECLQKLKKAIEEEAWKNACKKAEEGKNEAN